MTQQQTANSRSVANDLTPPGSTVYPIAVIRAGMRNSGAKVAFPGVVGPIFGGYNRQFAILPTFLT